MPNKKAGDPLPHECGPEETEDRCDEDQPRSQGENALSDCPSVWIASLTRRGQRRRLVPGSNDQAEVTI